MTNADVIRAHYAASDAGDIDGMVAPLSPHVTWTEAAGFPYAGTYSGPDEVVRNVFARIAEDWDAYRFTVDEVIDGGDTVVGIGAYSGTYRLTGRFFEARVAHVWRLKDGVVTAFEQFTDTAMVQKALRGSA
ncbi:nuclear transport factor 2 family protein [Microbacterium karelineae]|uniref:nuclear transport factor 2 family protein n=1 Tax=Microbacterium karelineae TaxID=2654283 RepID=UPI0012EA6B6A|nr:nuclear transport factor 2 family protein [Microbacterium karelineae]